jgi:RimJ/RimL family protein N-acetyltransferase
MPLREGAFIRSFTAKDGEVILRASSFSDLDQLLHYINSLVDEGADIAVDRRLSREEEAHWLEKHLADMEREAKAAVVAEMGGRLVGQVEVVREGGYSSHVGIIAIGVVAEHRGLGIGAELMREAESQAKGLGIRVLTLRVNAKNSRALRLYEKTGFRIVGRGPKAIKRDGRYVDRIIMAKEIEIDAAESQQSLKQQYQ